MSSERRRSTLIPIYKNKWEIQNHKNYHGIKLMSHNMKLWERVIEHRLRHETTISKNWFSFMPEWYTMEAHKINSKGVLCDDVVSASYAFWYQMLGYSTIVNGES